MRRYIYLIILKIIFASLTVAAPRLALAGQKHVPAEKLGSSEYCGLCHTDIYQQWNASSHHFSSFNNAVYRRVIESELGLNDREKLKFCAGCHDPIMLVSGGFDASDVNLNSWQANAGITCLVCHRMENMGPKNGDYTIAEPFLHPFALAQDEKLRKTHELLVELTPWIHSAVMSKAEYKTAEYCATCHELEVPAEINGRNDLLIFNEFSAWSGSHYAERGGEVERRCQDCHMPLIASKDPAAKEGKIHDHSFAAGNSFLPLINRDFSHLEKVEKLLSSGVIALNILDITPMRGSNGNADVRVDLKITNLGVGHGFPGGTADSTEVWLSVEVLDENGGLIWSRDVIRDEQPLDPDAFRIGTQFIDDAGNITSRASTATKAVARWKDNTIPPGESLYLALPVTLPEANSAERIFKIKLNWRKYSPEFIQWVFSGREVPPPKITVVAESTQRFVIGSDKNNIRYGAPPP